MPDWRIAWLICGICRQWRERPLHQVYEDRTKKKIICGYLLNYDMHTHCGNWILYTCCTWICNFNVFSVCLLKNTAAKYSSEQIMIENTCSEKQFLTDLQNKCIPHNKISSKWKRYFRSKNPIYILRKYLHSLFSLLFYVVFWYISSGT